MKDYFLIKVPLGSTTNVRQQMQVSAALNNVEVNIFHVKCNMTQCWYIIVLKNT